MTLFLGYLLILFFLGYLLIIHFGMAFLLLRSMFRWKHTRFALSRLKVACAVIGAVVVLPVLLGAYADNRNNPDSDTGLVVLTINIPGLILADAIPSDYFYLAIFIIDPLLGLIGGYGFGQFLEWIGDRRRSHQEMQST